jgi:hypothetical protein
MKMDASITRDSASNANTIVVSESAKRQIGTQASEATVLQGSKFFDSAFLDSPRTKRVQ